MMESPAENLNTGKMIRSNAFFFSDKKNYHREKEKNPRYVCSAAGIRVLLEKDAQRGGEVSKQMNQLKLKKEPRLNWDSNLSYESKQEKVFKMHPANMKKFLLLDIATDPRKSNGDLMPHAWYCIDLSKIRCEGDNWVVGTMGLNIRKMPRHSPDASTCVALGSVIYMIGRNYSKPRSIARIYYLDTSNPENEWLEGPFMNLHREFGSAVVHDKRIYVFGGFEYFRHKPCFGEVYDSVLNSWEPLSDIPVKLDSMQGKFVGSYKDKKILVHPCISGTLYAYDVVDKSWEVLDRDFGFWYRQGAIMDDVLYVFDSLRVEIGGYDLVRLKWLKPINLDSLGWFSRTKNSEGMVLYEAFFFKVEANVLCLLYFDSMGKEGLDIYCKTITIKKIMNEDGDVVLEAEVSSSTIYNLGEIGHCLKYVVV